MLIIGIIEIVVAVAVMFFRGKIDATVMSDWATSSLPEDRSSAGEPWYRTVVYEWLARLVLGSGLDALIRVSDVLVCVWGWWFRVSPISAAAPGAWCLHSGSHQLTAVVIIQSVWMLSPKVNVCSPVRLKPMAWWKPRAGSLCSHTHTSSHILLRILRLDRGGGQYNTRGHGSLFSPFCGCSGIWTRFWVSDDGLSRGEVDGSLWERIKVDSGSLQGFTGCGLQRRSAIYAIEGRGRWINMTWALRDLKTNSGIWTGVFIVLVVTQTLLCVMSVSMGVNSNYQGLSVKTRDSAKSLAPALSLVFLTVIVLGCLVIKQTLQASIRQRRKGLALLSLLGATPKQIRAVMSAVGSGPLFAILLLLIALARAGGRYRLGHWTLDCSGAVIICRLADSAFTGCGQESRHHIRLNSHSSDCLHVDLLLE